MVEERVRQHEAFDRFVNFWVHGNIPLPFALTDVMIDVNDRHLRRWELFFGVQKRRIDVKLGNLRDTETGVMAQAQDEIIPLWLAALVFDILPKTIELVLRQSCCSFDTHFCSPFLHLVWQKKVTESTEKDRQLVT